MSLYHLTLSTTVLLCLFSFSLGVFSLWRNPKAKVVRLWFLASIAVALWSLGYILILIFDDEVAALRSIKIVYFAAALIPILSFHFIAAFLFKDKSHKYLIYFGYVVALVFLVLATTTSYVVKGVRYLKDFGHYEEINSSGFIPFLIYFFFFAIYGVVLLIKAYLQSDGIRRKQVFYLMLAITIGFIGGSFNFLTDLTGVYPYGQMIVWLYPVLVTYGIFAPFQIKIRRI
jgi:hypothetical protein